MSISGSLSGGIGPPGATGVTGATGATGPAGAAGPANLQLSILAANATSVTATMAASGLSVNVVTGHKYAFRLIALLNDSSTAQASGAKLDFGGGSASATNFRAWAFDGGFGAFSSTSYTTSLSAAISSQGGFTDDQLTVEGAFEPGSTGTFAVRFAQLTRVDGTLTMYRGSHLTIWEP